jgi:polysaccharide biosynthesis/export protein
MSTKKPLLAAAILALSLVSCGTSRPHYDFAAEWRAAGAYKVGAGDVLQVRAWKNDALSERVTVRLDGYVTLPLVGEVQAGGRTVQAIAAEIATRASAFYTEPARVEVEVAELHGYRVYVLGEVARPGELTPRGEVTVLQALAMAGGFTRFAAPNEIVIVRRDGNGERRIPFVYREVVEKGDLRENLPLRTEDVVVVP